MNNDSLEQLTTRIGRLRLKRRGSIPALTIFVVYSSTSRYDENEVEAFYMDLEKFYREDHTFFKVIIGDFNAKIGPRRSSEEHHIETNGLEWKQQGEWLPQFIKTTKINHSISHLQKPNSQRCMRELSNREYSDEIDHIIINRTVCLISMAIVSKF
uniref:Endo/exonuclease/phosphatase domain-containing protein n=1 Tax=Angiostrongylus cantonensis TaxID=6313 RepID=A0A0K0DG06_ANGCA